VSRSAICVQFVYKTGYGPRFFPERPLFQNVRPTVKDPHARQDVPRTLIDGCEVPGPVPGMQYIVITDFKHARH
ncbi:MAG: hypothetical protein MK364_01685, partial [Pirellulales bacterium]|nr:hypothetical protein [Pirellulales bacterium]